MSHSRGHRIFGPPEAERNRHHDAKKSERRGAAHPFGAAYRTAGFCCACVFGKHGMLHQRVVRGEKGPVRLLRMFQEQHPVCGSTQFHLQSAHRHLHRAGIGYKFHADRAHLQRARRPTFRQGFMKSAAFELPLTLAHA